MLVVHEPIGKRFDTDIVPFQTQAITSSHVNPTRLTDRLRTPQNQHLLVNSTKHHIPLPSTPGTGHAHYVTPFCLGPVHLPPTHHALSQPLPAPPPPPTPHP